MTFKKCKVVMLPTNEKANSVSDLILFKNKLRKCLAGGEFRKLLSEGGIAYSIYILSDEKIKVGDWFYYKHFGEHIISQAKETTDLNNLNKPDKYFKKIIATTNKALKLNSIKVPLISDFTLKEISENMPCLPQPTKDFIEKFIEEYNKGNKIETVLVEYGYTINKSLGHFHQYREYFLKINPKDNTITIKKVKDNWNREEVIDILHVYGLNLIEQIETKSLEEQVDINKWIEENL